MLQPGLRFADSVLVIVDIQILVADEVLDPVEGLVEVLLVLVSHVEFADCAGDGLLSTVITVLTEALALG